METRAADIRVTFLSLHFALSVSPLMCTQMVTPNTWQNSSSFNQTPKLCLLSATQEEITIAQVTWARRKSYWNKVLIARFYYSCPESDLQQFHPSPTIEGSTTRATGFLLSMSHYLSPSPLGCKFLQAGLMMSGTLYPLCFLHRSWQREGRQRC